MKRIAKIVIALVLVAALVGGVKYFTSTKESRELKELGMVKVTDSNSETENLSPEEIREMLDNANLLSYTISEEEEQAYRDSLAKEESDIEGWTKLDKYDAGLDKEDGSDSDRDGLTDKEEIEIYHSDPLKESTADDLYTDGYKAENNMDVLTYYEYEGEFKFPYKKCDNFFFEAKHPHDAYAEVREEKNHWDLSKPLFDAFYGDYIIFKEYKVSGFCGKLSIDVSEVLTENEIEISDITILMGGPFGDSPEEMEYEADGTKITLKEEFYHTGSYSLTICKKKKEGFTFNSEAKFLNQLNYGDAFAYYCPLLTFSDYKPTIYYVESGNKEVDTWAVKNLVEAGNVLYQRSDKDEVRVVKDDIKIVSQSELDRKRDFFLGIFPDYCKQNPYTTWKMGETHTRDPEPVEYIFSCFDYEDIADVVTDEKERKFMTDFEKEFEFNFQNFCSTVSPGGNCAGIALYAARLYNNKSFPSKGSYFFETINKTIEWDLSTDEENATLLDADLSDFKDENFVNNHKKPVKFASGNEHTIMSDLTDGEEQFINMIGCLWREKNDCVSVKDHITDSSRPYKWKSIKKVMNHLDDDEVLLLGLTISPKSYHAVNVYGYKTLNKEGTKVRFYLYDSNFPHNRTNYGEGYKNYDIYDVALDVEKKADGSFDYQYKPFVYVNGNEPYYWANYCCDSKIDKEWYLVFSTDDGEVLK